MKAAFRKRGNESSLEEKFISAAFSYNNKQNLHRITILTTKGRTNFSIENELARKMGYPGSLGTWSTLDGPGARLPSAITLEEKDIKIAMQVFNVERDVGISVLQPGIRGHLEALKDIRSRYPEATEERIVSLFNTAVEDLAGRSTSKYSITQGIQQDDLGTTEEVAHVIRIAKVTHQQAVILNKFCEDGFLRALELNRAQVSQETEEQVAKKMTDLIYRMVGEDAGKDEGEAPRQRA